MNNKIVICSDDYLPKIGGISTCTHELATALHDSGWQVILLTRSHPNSESHDCKLNFEVIRLNAPLDSILAIPKYIKAIRKIKKRESPDLFLHMTWLPCAAAHWFSRTSTPYGVYAHGVELLESNRTFKKNLRRKISFLKKKIFKRAHWTFAVSHFTASLLKDRCSARPENLHVVFNGVDTEKFFPAKTNLDGSSKTIDEFDLNDDTKSNENRRQLLTVCRLQANKGIDQTLKALAEIKDSYDFSYLVAGDGPEMSHLKKMTENLGLTDHVQFLGSIPESQLLRLYNSTDIFIMLSRFDERTPAVEGFGIAFLEAGACKKPVIAGDSGGISDAVIDGKTGILVDPEDTESIQKAIEKLLSNRDLCRQYGENAFQRIHEQFTWHQVAENVSEALKRGL